MFDVLDDFKPYGHWLVRIALAGIFVIHGLGNIMNLDGFATGLHLPYLVALVIAVAEIGGGILVLAGGYLEDWMTRVGALLLLLVMLIMFFMVHWATMSFSLSKVHLLSGMEMLLVLFLVSLFVLLKGNKV